jgi:hypothetical protein
VALHSTDKSKESPDLAPPKIRLYQTGVPYPSLHIMVTHNVLYLGEGLVVESLDKTKQRVEKWLKETMENYNDQYKNKK